jgi:hypothetical protein
VTGRTSPSGRLRALLLADITEPERGVESPELAMTSVLTMVGARILGPPGVSLAGALRYVSLRMSVWLEIMYVCVYMCMYAR